MDLLEALTQFPELVARIEDRLTRLEETERELAAIKEDRYVDWDWICDYFGVSEKTARLMLAEEKLFVHGQQIKRFKKSQIIRFAERNSIKVKEVKG